MAISVKHKFQSAKGDPADTTLVRPSNWNDSHDIALAADTLLGRSSSGAGDAEEVPCTAFGRSILSAENIAALAAAGFGVFTTGDTKITLKTAADDGWVMMNDGTIGDEDSGASRSNDDCEDLFALLWANFTDALCPIYTSAGVVSARGATASADWDAHKRIQLPLVLGRALAVAGLGANLTSRSLGAFVGTETHTLTSTQVPATSVSVSGSAQVTNGSGTPSKGVADGQNSTGLAVQTGSAASFFESDKFDHMQVAMTSTGSVGGGGGSHPNMQPTAFLNLMVKL